MPVGSYVRAEAEDHGQATDHLPTRGENGKNYFLWGVSEATDQQGNELHAERRGLGKGWVRMRKCKFCEGVRAFVWAYAPLIATAWMVGLAAVLYWVTVR